MNTGFFKQLLLNKQTQLEALADESINATQTVELDQSKVGRLSRMDALQQQAMSKATEQRRVQELIQVQQALNRIDEDNYGFCDECGELINQERLKLNPTTTFCIGCASKLEN